MAGNRILDLQQRRTQAVKDAADLMKVAADEKRALTSEETEKYDRIYNEVRSIGETLARETQQLEMEASFTETRSRQQEESARGAGANAGGTPDEAREAFRSFIKRGYAGVKPEHRALLIEGSQNSHNFTLPPEMRAAQSELTGSTGGYLVPQGFYAQVAEALKYFGGMNDAGATEINTAMGNDLPMPTANDTTVSATLLGESSPANTAPIAFNQVIFKAYKYTSNLILIPIELLQDSGVDIEAFVTKQIVTRFGRARNAVFTAGAGTTVPRGIVLDAVNGKTGANGQGTGLIYSDLIDLKYSVNRAYRKNAKWMMNDQTLKTVLKIVDDNHRPLILDYLNALQAGEPEQILGQMLVNNDDMPDLGTTGSPAVGNKAILYGDMSNYWIRNVSNMMLMRLTERFAEYGQVAFLAFMRFDGRLVDAGTNPVKAYTCPTA